MKSKFEEAFSGFSAPLSEGEISQEVKKIIDLHYDHLNTKDTIAFLHGCVDLTTLSPLDSEDVVYNLVREVNELDETNPTIPPVAAICVYPNFVSIVREQLSVEKVAIACVSGAFPSSQTFLDVKMVETGLALKDGADEVDIVLHLGNFLSGNYQEVVDEISEIRTLCRDQHLKVILETGALKTPESIHRASVLSLFCEADFIKTSTGKEFPGASLEAVYVMCQVLKEYYEKYGVRRGLKVSGGVRTTEQALQYLCIVREVLGEEWFDSSLFRIGASSLVKDLQKHLL